MIKWFELDIGKEEVDAVTESVRNGWISGSGPHIKEFEERFAEKVGAKHGISVCNGTCGLLTILLAFKYLLKKRPLIAIPTWTYLATVTSADLIGRIQLVDADISTFNMLTRVPKDVDIIMPVDVGGMPVDYSSFLDYAKPVVSDSAEAIGAIYRRQKVGGISHAHLFSLHAAKMITTGEGGMITTNDSYLYELMKQIRNQGYAQPVKTEYVHQIKGFNFRMTEMQAAIGLVQLRKLDAIVARRRKIMQVYREIIGEKVGYQEEPSDRMSSFWLASILVNPDKRDSIVNHLIENGIEVKVWRPAHLQPPFLGGTFPNAEYLYQRNIHLPSHNKLTDEDVEFVAETVRRYL